MCLNQNIACPVSPCSRMAKGKKTKQGRSKTITLKVVQNCLELTLDGKHRLNLSFKEVAVVPKCIQKLCNVDELDLSRNLIRKVPDFIESFISIQVLDLHSNCLDQLPETIGRLQNLLVLNLCNNHLTSLPRELRLLKKLHTLNLGLNQLETLPPSIGALKELRHLGLSDNRLTRVPGCLSRLKKLEWVNLDRNPIRTEEALGHESLVLTERLYLVKDSFLCEDCLKRCRTERKKVEKGNQDWEYPI
ncbi:leucine-rich repeat-containing protein 18-like isoform X1 [Epinephelus fuscoguttatus]|uniref:leucine-rich repeat-containing protein 18-like isoform X1 n=2 Tax=Epinephelus fuscoguttatus TaxID=293821 RepID=UPI0020D1950A|nr:leucine-rich repeat-containing protein 18-like isoform X1 [Epinephelus fuscoguttatus]